MKCIIEPNGDNANECKMTITLDVNEFSWMNPILQGEAKWKECVEGRRGEIELQRE